MLTFNSYLFGFCFFKLPLHQQKNTPNTINKLNVLIIAVFDEFKVNTITK